MDAGTYGFLLLIKKSISLIFMIMNIVIYNIYSGYIWTILLFQVQKLCECKCVHFLMQQS